MLGEQFTQYKMGEEMLTVSSWRKVIGAVTWRYRAPTQSRSAEKPRSRTSRPVLQRCGLLGSVCDAGAGRSPSWGVLLSMVKDDSLPCSWSYIRDAAPQKDDGMPP
jgi:hypothetical protein